MIVTVLCRKSRHSSVGTATRYGRECSGIESQWGGGYIPHPSRLTLGPIRPLVQCVLSFLPESKTARAWRWPPTTPSSTEVKERVELYVFNRNQLLLILLYLFCIELKSQIRVVMKQLRRSRWPRRLRRRSAADRLLRLRVPMPPGHGCLFL